MIVQAHVINMIAAHAYVLTIIKLSVGGLGEEGRRGYYNLQCIIIYNLADKLS